MKQTIKERNEKAKTKMRKRRKLDPDKVRIMAKAWRLKNPERTKEHSKRSRSKPGYKERTKVYQKAWSERNRPRLREMSREYYQNRKDVVRDQNLQKNVGITLNEYYSMLIIQNYVCALCYSDSGIKGKLFAVDHNHETGKIRGLLCRGCNVGIGNLKDDPDLLNRAVGYIREGGIFGKTYARRPTVQVTAVAIQEDI